MVANATDWKGSLTIDKIRVNATWAYFSTTTQPPNTCSLWGEFLMFDYKTEAGQVYYNSLLAAKMANKKIDIWYVASSAPDTNQSNGCNETTASLLYGLRVH